MCYGSIPSVIGLFGPFICRFVAAANLDPVSTYTFNILSSFPKVQVFIDNIFDYYVILNHYCELIFDGYYDFRFKVSEKYLNRF